jgi:hypothetical protein
MIPIDLDRARAAHSALDEFFAAHPKGKLDRVAEDEIRGLCRAARISSGCGCRTLWQPCAAT